MNIDGINSREEGINILSQFYDKAVPFTIGEDSKIVNAERVAATLIIPESCFPFTGYGYEINNNYHYQSKISGTLDHIFLRLYIENEGMTDSRREFNLVFCPNDHNPKVKELVRIMAFSGQDLIRVLIIGQYSHDTHLKLSKLKRKRGAQFAADRMKGDPDLSRHYVFMDFRASDVALFNMLKYHEIIPADYISVITKLCLTCRKHFMNMDRT